MHEGSIEPVGRLFVVRSFSSPSLNPLPSQSAPPVSHITSTVPSADDPPLKLFAPTVSVHGAGHGAASLTQAMERATPPTGDGLAFNPCSSSKPTAVVRLDRA